MTPVKVVGSYYTDVTGGRFLYEAGRFTPLPVMDDPQDINNKGDIVNFEGSLYHAGVITTIRVPGADITHALGINDSGQIVGYTAGPFYSGYLYSDGDTTFDVPGAEFGSVPYGIDNSGEIVGTYSYDGTSSGFLKSGDSFTTINYPGGAPTVLTGINDRGFIVGNWHDADIPHGFLYQNGIFTDVVVPGSTLTGVYGINNLGQMVGYFTDNGFQFHGFITQPLAIPEPGTFMLRGLGVLTVCRRLRARAASPVRD
jgi:probable HAF family extracellular repeat protein